MVDGDLESGRLLAESKIRSDKLFSVEAAAVMRTVGRIIMQAHVRLKGKIFEILE